MGNLKIDGNFIAVSGGVADNANQDIEMLRLDPSTNRLLIVVVGESSSDLSANNKIDENFIRTSSGVTDDASQDIYAFKLHPTTKNLLIDLVAE